MISFPFTINLMLDEAYPIPDTSIALYSSPLKATLRTSFLKDTENFVVLQIHFPTLEQLYTSRADYMYKKAPSRTKELLTASSSNRSSALINFENRDTSEINSE